MTGELVFMGGVFNIVDPFFHWQLYIWTWIFAGIIGIASWTAWYYGKWTPFEPLWGLYYAAKAGSDAAFVTGPQLYFNLCSEAEAKCIFDYKSWNYELPKSLVPDAIRRILFNYASAFPIGLSPRDAITHKLAGINDDVRIAKRLQDGEWSGAPSVTIGATPTDIILDADHWIERNSPQHRAIEAAALRWNQENEKNQIHSYSKFLQLLQEGIIPLPDGITTEITVPWERIDATFPLKYQDNELGGYRGQAAEEMAAEEQDQIKHLGIKILIGVAAFAAMVYIGRFVSFTMSLPH